MTARAAVGRWRGAVRRATAAWPSPGPRRVIVPLLGGLLLGGAGPAWAGTVTSRNGCAAEGRVCGSETVYRAGAGERNDVTVAQDGRSVVITDAGALVRAAGACVAIDPHRARCPSGFFGPSGGGDSLEVELGDLDDRATALTGAVVRGGPGDDLLQASSPSTLLGGAGTDTLTGSPGPDGLDGGSGRDVLHGGPAAAGAADSGDTVSYRHRVRPVRVDLARGVGGEPGEDDVLADIEHAEGGRGDDVLTGTAGVSELEGGGGDDLLRGRDGNDALRGGEGDDRVDGGRGRDSLDGGEGSNRLDGGSGDDALDPGDSRTARSRVVCGAGRDRVGATAPRTLVGGDCERVAVGGVELRRLPTIGRRRAVFIVTRCYDGCRLGTLELAVQGRRVASGRVAHGGRRLVVSYTARGRALLARRRGALVVRAAWREGAERVESGYSTRWPPMRDTSTASCAR